jgi:hypothetical protein
VYAITTQEVIFYAIIWSMAFLSAVARGYRDDDYRSVGHLIALGSTSGLFSVAVVSILHDYIGDSIGGAWGRIGIATMMGFFAKDQDKIGRAILSRAIGVMREALGKESDGTVEEGSRESPNPIEQSKPYRSQEGPRSFEIEQPIVAQVETSKQGTPLIDGVVELPKDVDKTNEA